MPEIVLKTQGRFSDLAAKPVARECSVELDCPTHCLLRLIKIFDEYSLKYSSNVKQLIFVEFILQLGAVKIYFAG